MDAHPGVITRLMMETGRRGSLLGVMSKLKLVPNLGYDLVGSGLGALLQYQTSSLGARLLCRGLQGNYNNC